MKKHAIELSAILLGLLALAAAGVLLFYIAGLASTPWLLCAALALLGGYVALLALFLVTNTRRPHGIDPNVAPVLTLHRDPFGQTSEELRQGVLLPDQRPYGRRASDDSAVVQRLIDRLERDDSARPAPPTTPAWALDLMQNHEPDTGLAIPPVEEQS